METEETTRTKIDNNKNGFPFVIIGTSAEGTEALVKFASSIPPGSGAAYIVVTPYSADTELMFREIEKNSPKIPVVKISGKISVKPDQFYIIPQNHIAALADGSVTVSRVTDPENIKMPIDHFIRSVADSHKENALVVLLGGYGTDGSLGIKSIREAGGAVFAQDPYETNYSEMLRSAVETGCVDFTLPAEKIPEHLQTYIRTIPLLEKTAPGNKDNIDYLQKILNLVKTSTGNDFSQYKKSTVYRRIEKRMSLHEITGYSQYLKYLQDHQEEIKHLFDDMLISVTNFFRDPEAFESLKFEVFPKLLANKPDNYVVRVWVPACATGEEAYSLAMLLHEYCQENNKNFKLQIFGTDINEESIQKARMGVFLDNIKAEISSERLEKYFLKIDGSYLVKKEIRESVIFAIQNITKDAPFTKLDLLSCRNMLIYFGADLQDRLIPVFHYSLKPDGVLFLGSSESLGKFSDAFKVIDKKWKLFQKLDAYSHNISSNLVFKAASAVMGGTAEIKKPKDTGLADLVHRTLMNSFTPPGVLINERGDILYVHGHTGKFLEIASGQANLNILNMAKEGLQYDLHSAVHEAIVHKREAVRTGIQLKSAGSQVRIIVKPVDSPETSLMILLVIFEEIEGPKPPRDEIKGKKKKYTGKAEELRLELQVTRENLQTTIEELQASNEELQSANEELQSTNEELQSTNEEMETSKEELQSVNEELITLNAELQSKIEQLSRAEDDMRNLLNSTNIGTIFLDSEMRIKRFTSEAVKIINLINTDVGRPIEHIVTNLHYNSLTNDIKGVLTSLNSIEREVQTKEGSWYLLRIMPYKTVDNIIDGVVLTFTEMTTYKNASDKVDQLSDAVRAEKEYANSILDMVKIPIIVLNSDNTVAVANNAFCSKFRISKELLLNRGVFDIAGGELNSKVLEVALSKLSRSGKSDSFYIKVDHDTEIFVNIGKIHREGVNSYMLFLSFEEKTI